MADRDELLGITDAAKYLGLSRARLHAIVKTRPFGRVIAGRRLFTKSELDWFKAQPRPRGVHINKRDPEVMPDFLRVDIDVAA